MIHILLEVQTDTNDRNNPPCPGNSQSESRTHAQWEYGPLNGIPGATDIKQYKHTVYYYETSDITSHVSLAGSGTLSLIIFCGHVSLIYDHLAISRLQFLKH